MASDLFCFPPFKCTVRPFIFTKKAPQKQQKQQINKSTQRQQKENNIETNFLNHIFLEQTSQQFWECLVLLAFGN